jgi:tRNA threonylcarbamoyladenosine biosynthesis protein TsaE
LSDTHLKVERFESVSPDETRAIAAKLARFLKPGDLVALQGELGAGKTVLAQGIAHGLGISEEQVVRSPTFSIFNIHEGARPMVHVDLYRIGNPDEVEALGLLDLLPEYVMAVEWFEQAHGLLGTPALVIQIDDAEDDPEKRSIECRWN